MALDLSNYTGSDVGLEWLNRSRREFLGTMAAAAGATFLAPRRLRAEQLGLRKFRALEVDPRVAEIVARTIAVDMHSHVQIPFAKTPAESRPEPVIDLAAELKKAGFSAVCETFNLDAANIDASDYYKYHLQALAFEDRLLEKNHMRRALTMRDLETAHAQRVPIIIQSVEGAQFMEGRLDRIEESYKRGLRHLQLVHEKDDSVKPLGDVYTAPAHLGGLTASGEEVVKECNRLGIVVDMAHGTTETVMGALKAATEPLIVSHTSLTRDTDNADMKRRLISRDCARAVAEAGGVIGVWWRLCTSVAEYVASVKSMVDAVGIEHVGIGTDSDLTASYALPYTNRIWPDQAEGFFYAVAAEMLKQGFTAEEIGKFGGGNFCRVFAKVTASRG